MKPAESEWTKQYWELIARHEILLLKRKEGVYDTHEWNRLIEDMDKHKMFALANDIRKEMPNHEMHAKFWRALSKKTKWSGGGRIKANGEFEELTGDELNIIRKEMEG